MLPPHDWLKIYESRLFMFQVNQFPVFFFQVLQHILT